MKIQYLTKYLQLWKSSYNFSLGICSSFPYSDNCYNFLEEPITIINKVMNELFQYIRYQL